MTQEIKFSELHEVCAVGDSDMLEEMLMSGKHHHHLDYKDPDWEERTPLHWCCIKGKSDMVANLLEKGAHPGIRSSSGWTPAHYAAEGGRVHVLRTLHKSNAPMDRKDLFGDSPRRIAEVYGHKEAAEFLIIAEADYKVTRRKAELSGEVDLYDDEDVEWCYRNNIKPEAYITEDEIAEITSTVTSLSLDESFTTGSKVRTRAQHLKPGKTVSARTSISTDISTRSSRNSNKERRRKQKQNKSKK